MCLLFPCWSAAARYCLTPPVWTLWNIQSHSTNESPCPTGRAALLQTQLFYNLTKSEVLCISSPSPHLCRPGHRAATTWDFIIIMKTFVHKRRIVDFIIHHTVQTNINNQVGTQRRSRSRAAVCCWNSDDDWNQNEANTPCGVTSVRNMLTCGEGAVGVHRVTHSDCITVTKVWQTEEKHLLCNLTWKVRPTRWVTEQHSSHPVNVIKTN